MNVSVVEDVMWVRVDDASSANELRRAAVRVAQGLGFPQDRLNEVAIAVLELATNAHLHAETSAAAVRIRRHVDGTASLEIVMSDSGPGINDISTAMLDGVSTSGTLGIGLGAIGRLANRFDLYSMPGRGTVSLVEFGSRPNGSAAASDADETVGGLTRPINGETVCGDAWSYARNSSSVSVIVADGLGHGPIAALASTGAVREFERAPAAGPLSILQSAHATLGATRGAAVSVAHIDLAAGVLRFAGIGNVVGRIVGGARPQSLIAQPGIVGHHMGKVREVELPVVRGSLVILHSDGLTSKWNLDGQRDLVGRSTNIIAAVLLRDAGLRHDDATVVVIRVP